MTDYNTLNAQLDALTRDTGLQIANLANAAALLYHTLPELNWAGFYMLEGDTLVLGPFQGKTACIRIPMGNGVCGTAAQKNETVVVPDVHRFPGHVACDCASNSEIVIPLRKDGRVIGVLDIDSPVFGRFSDADQKGLEAFAAILEQNL